MKTENRSYSSFLIGIVLLSLPLIANAQINTGKHAITVEALGVSQSGSVNYERVLKVKEKYFINGRVGVGIDASLLPGIPHGITFCFGKSTRFLETGMLASLGYTSFGYADASAIPYYLAPMLGYRSQRSRGLVFKIYACPLVPVSRELDVGFRIGLGLGYAWKKSD